MLISPVNYNVYRNNKIQSNVKTQTVNFQGQKNLQAVDLNSFKNDGTKLLYGKIKKYLQIIGDIGKIENVPLNKTNDAFLSIDKNIDKTNILIKTNNDKNLMNMIFNKDGQMTIGDFNTFHFERTGKNRRTLRTSQATLTPHGYDDREFGLTKIDTMGYKKNPLFELFMEFARLHVSIFK